MEALMPITEILEILPHRYPFLLVDRVLEQKDGEGSDSRQGHSARTIKNVSFNEPFFQGHFPGLPIMPGVLLVEAMAQTAALAYYRRGDEKILFMIAGIEKAKFRRPVTPGDRLEMTAQVIKDRRTMLLVECQARVEGQVVAEATLLAALSKRSSQKDS